MEDFQQFARYLGVDAVLQGSITDYDVVLSTSNDPQSQLVCSKSRLSSDTSRLWTSMGDQKGKEDSGVDSTRVRAFARNRTAEDADPTIGIRHFRCPNSEAVCVLRSEGGSNPMGKRSNSKQPRQRVSVSLSRSNREDDRLPRRRSRGNSRSWWSRGPRNGRSMKTRWSKPSFADQARFMTGNASQ